MCGCWTEKCNDPVLIPGFRQVWIKILALSLITALWLWVKSSSCSCLSFHTGKMCSLKYLSPEVDVMIKRDNSYQYFTQCWSIRGGNQCWLPLGDVKRCDLEVNRVLDFWSPTWMRRSCFSLLCSMLSRVLSSFRSSSRPWPDSPPSPCWAWAICCCTSLFFAEILFVFCWTTDGCKCYSWSGQAGRKHQQSNRGTERHNLTALWAQTVF